MLKEIAGHFYNLLAATWANVLAGLSTSTAAILIFTFAVPVLIWVSINIIKWRRNMSPLKQILKESLASALITAGVTLFAWIIIIGCYGVKTIYQDHMELVKKNQNLRHQVEDMKKQAAPSLPTPNLASIRLAGEKHVASTDRRFPFGLEVVLQTDTTIEPVSYAIIFSGEVSTGDAFVESYRDYPNKLEGVINGKPNVFAFQWSSPAFTPDKPIKIMVYSKKYIKVITWKTWTKVP